MQVTRFLSDPGRVERFLAFGREVQAADAQRIPAFPEQVRHLMAPGFLPEGSVQHVLVEDEGGVRARCSAFVSRGIEHEGRPAGLVGLFEATDAEAGAAAVEAAVAWLREERGLGPVLGPMDHSIWHAYRFMTRGFETEPFLGEPRNPAWYPEVFESVGFEGFARWNTWDLERPDLETLRDAAAARADPELFGARGYGWVPIRLGDGFEDDLARFHEVVAAGFAKNTAFCPMPLAEFQRTFGAMRPFLVPELVPLIHDPDGRAVGLYYLYPDMAPAFLAANGEPSRLTPELFAAHPPRRVVFHTQVFLEDARLRELVYGGFARLVDEVLARFDRAAGALAKEGRTFYDKTGGPTRTYALYALSAGAGPGSGGAA